ncbi:MAG TPA: glycosyl hydrolase, partial [Puia sp.]|nr:glycosyl hydrolase [Puia sp.]
SYSILVLPKLETMRPELLAKIKELVNQGAVVLGPKPRRSPSLAGYPEADKRVKSMADELWGNVDGITTKVHHYGKGLIIDGMTMQQAFGLTRVLPDLKITQSDSILFIHRRINDGAIYFVSNQKNGPVRFDARFRITGKSPQLWNAIDGSVRDLPGYWDNGKTTLVPLELAPYESAFIVFKKSAARGDSTRRNYPVTEVAFAVDQPWTIDFDSKMRGPAKPVVFDTLMDWAKNTNDSIKYYSGTAWYHNTFNIGKVSKGIHYVIDLGVARAIAKVTVNGIEMGGVWTPPYQVDITRAVKPGINKLDIKVVNTWVNRLIGDSKLPTSQRKTSVLFGPNPEGGLESSGLLGPVAIKQMLY